jgi:5-methylcytosine-specific restriction protein A
MAEKPKQFKPIQQRRLKQYRPKGQRESRSRRGYDRTWYRLQKQHLAAEPLCRHCLSHGKVTAAECVDHIKPFKGQHDPLRLDSTNLQSLCWSCHSTKTATQQER